MQNVCNNAYEKYLKSRPPASSESNKRIKEINISNAGILPEFRNSNSQAEDLLSKMKNYRPRGVNNLNLINLMNILIKYANILIMKFFFRRYLRSWQNPSL